MKYQEQTVTVKAEGCEMFGIVSLPANGTFSRACAVLIVTGGAQYRIGSHRQFTRMARELASAGYPAMRFDMPGMGDSTGEQVPFERSAAHIGAAVERLASTSGIQNICLWGLCDGASASLLYMNATRDARIAAIVLLNPWMRSEISLARVHVKYYYPRRLLQADFWRKLLSGNIGSRAAFELADSLRQMAKSTTSSKGSIQNQMAKGWSLFKGPLLLLLSEKDFTAQEFKEYMHKDALWSAIVQKKPPVQYVLQNADHTCSQTDSHASMVSQTLIFLNHCAAKL